jgi:hypothetical protein
MANRDAPTSTQGSPARHLTFAELGIGSAIFWPSPGARAGFPRQLSRSLSPRSGVRGCAKSRFGRSRGNSIYGGWRDQLEVGFAMEFRPPRRRLFKEPSI